MFHVSPGEAVEQPTRNPKEIIPETGGFPSRIESIVRFIQILKIFWVVATQIFFFMFTPKIGEDEPILTSIFFVQRGWWKTTN